MLLLILIIASSLGQLSLAHPSVTSASVALSFNGTLGGNGTSGNGTYYCPCYLATGVSWGIGLFVWPLLLVCCGFCCSGVRAGSGAAGYQSMHEGGETGGCFSVLQSCGAGGCNCGYLLCCLVWASVIAVGVHFSCVSVCPWLYTLDN